MEHKWYLQISGHFLWNKEALLHLGVIIFRGPIEFREVIFFL